jgi:spermidine synthase
VIGPGGGRDLLSALVFGATRIDGVEINPIIATDIMQDRFRAYSGGIYQDPRVAIHVDDGRSFVRRSASRYDVIQASLVDTWAATAAGAYTLTENSLYTTEAFGEYIRPSHRSRSAHDHSLGIRRTPPGIARTSRLRRSWT